MLVEILVEFIYVLSLVDGKRIKSNIGYLVENIHITNTEFQDGSFDIDVTGKNLYIVKSIHEKPTLTSNTFKCACKLAISTNHNINSESCVAELPLVTESRSLSILVGRNGYSWSGNLKDPTKHINLPPLDLQTISSNSPHYFHTSITSSIYKE
ncbi:hypothetical protein SNEBB_001565, partial [Seison nebaliae]